VLTLPEALAIAVWAGLVLAAIGLILGWSLAPGAWPTREAPGFDPGQGGSTPPAPARRAGRIRSAQSR